LKLCQKLFRHQTIFLPKSERGVVFSWPLHHQQESRNENAWTRRAKEAITPQAGFYCESNYIGGAERESTAPGADAATRRQRTR
jgi:hypothetical protein